MTSNLLSDFNRDLKRLNGAFEIARLCLRFAVAATERGADFDSAVAPGLDVYAQLVGVIGGQTSAVLATSAVDQLAELIAGSANPPLAAWITADVISVSIGQNFRSSMNSPAKAPRRGSSEHALGHLDAYFLNPKACAALYGEGIEFSERAGPLRDRFNPAAVRGLALWIEQPTAYRIRVIVDTAVGEQFHAALDSDGLNIGLAQPNRDLSELTVAWFSEPDDPDPRFFGVHPKEPHAQHERILQSVRRLSDRVGILVVPELVTTRAHADSLLEELTGDGGRQVRIVVSGSFHEEAPDARRNTTYIYARDLIQGFTRREHSKSGAFAFKMTADVIERMLVDEASPDGSRDWMTGKTFREDVRPSKEIRLYTGTKFSAAVVICADFLESAILDVLKQLRVSLVLICNMTPKVDGFDSAAQGLIQRAQTTTVMVNNPASWPIPGGYDAEVEGAIVCAPMANRSARTVAEHFPDSTTDLVYNTVARRFTRHSGRTA